MRLSTYTILHITPCILFILIHFGSIKNISHQDIMIIALYICI